MEIHVLILTGGQGDEGKGGEERRAEELREMGEAREREKMG